MDNKDKLKVYEEYKERKEEEIIKNAGETYNFGDTTITIRELPWGKADAFEDKVLELVNTITTILKTTIDDEDSLVDTLKKIDITDILKTFLNTILRTGLLDLANIATNGEITKDYILKQNATKSQVIKIVVHAIKLNYGYLKNLIPLVTRSL
jgi:hypothetical protein